MLLFEIESEAVIVKFVVPVGGFAPMAPYKKFPVY
jgi:hypothetical protein